MAEPQFAATRAATWVWPAAVAGSVVLVALFAVLVPREEYEGVGGVAVTTAIVLTGWVGTLRLSAREPDAWVRRFMQVGFWLQVLAAGAFYLLVFHGQGGDAGRFHRVGTEIARTIRTGDWEVLFDRGLHGSAMMENLAGLLYVGTGPSAVTGFVVFALLGFLGSYLAFRALVRAVPDGSHRLYAGLVFLLPSMLFWPASLGKEAWMIGMLGLSVWGAARVLEGRRGVVLLLLGVSGQALLRPHMAAMSLTALAAAPLIRRPPGDTRPRRRGRALLLVVVLAAGSAATVAMQQTFGLSSLSPGAVTGFLDTMAENTARGDSAFSNVETVNPLLAPLAFVSVLLRPFPHEATTVLMWLASLESLFVAALLVARWRSLRHALRLLRTHGYVAFATVYTVLFVLGYSFFSNLGLLMRERVQVLPVLFVLVAVNRWHVPQGSQAASDSSPDGAHSTVPMSRPRTSRIR